MNEVMIVLSLVGACAASVWLGRHFLMYYPLNPSGKNDFTDWWLATETREAWGRVLFSIFVHAFLWLFLKEMPFAKGGYFASLIMMVCRQWWMVSTREFGKARSKAIEDYEGVLPQRRKE